MTMTVQGSGRLPIRILWACLNRQAHDAERVRSVDVANVAEPRQPRPIKLPVCCPEQRAGRASPSIATSS